MVYVAYTAGYGMHAPVGVICTSHTTIILVFGAVWPEVLLCHKTKHTHARALINLIYPICYIFENGAPVGVWCSIYQTMCLGEKMNLCVYSWCPAYVVTTSLLSHKQKKHYNIFIQVMPRTHCRVEMGSNESRQIRTKRARTLLFMQNSDKKHNSRNVKLMGTKAPYNYIPWEGKGTVPI